MNIGSGLSRVVLGVNGLGKVRSLVFASDAYRLIILHWYLEGLNMALTLGSSPCLVFLNLCFVVEMDNF